MSLATTPENDLVGNTRDAYPPDVRVARHLIDFLRWRFSRHPAGAYRWDPATGHLTGQDSSEIFLSHETPVNPQNVGQRPAVSCAVGSLGFQGVGIGDLAFVDWATGSQVRMDLIPTFTRIHVLSRVPFEARRLAWYVAEQIWAFRDAITKEEQVLLSIGQRPTISEPTLAGSLVGPSTSHEWTAVVVQFPTFIQHAVTTMPMNKTILNAINTAVKLPQPGVTEAQSVGASDGTEE